MTVLAIAIVILGAALRLAGLGRAGIWFDEGYSASLARLPVSEIREALVHDSGPPLLYVLLHFTPRVGQDEFWLRLPGAIASILTLPLVYWLAVRVAGIRAGFWALLLVSLSPLQVHYAQEARFYPFLTFLVVCAAAGLAGALCSRSKAGLLIYAVCATGLLYTHNVGILFVTGCFLACLIRVRDRRWLVLLAVCHAAIVIAYLPWVPVLLDQMAGTSGVIHWMVRQWKAYPPILAPWRTLEAWAFTPKTASFVGVNYLAGLAPVGALLTLGLAVLGIRRTDETRWPAGLIAWFLVFPLVALFVYSFHQPVYLAGRTDAALVPLFLILVAAGLCRLRPFNAWVPWLMCALLVLPACGFNIDRQLRAPDPADREAAGWITRNARPQDAIVLCGPTAVTFGYYLRRDLPGNTTRLFPSRLEREFGAMRTQDSQQQLSEEAALLESALRRTTAQGGRVFVSGIESSVSEALVRYFNARGWTSTGDALRFRTARQDLPGTVVCLTRDAPGVR